MNGKKKKKKGNTNNWLAADHEVYGSVLYTVELYLSSGLVMSVIANVVQFLQVMDVSAFEVSFSFLFEIASLLGSVVEIVVVSVWSQ